MYYNDLQRYGGLQSNDLYAIMYNDDDENMRTLAILHILILVS